MRRSLRRVWSAPGVYMIDSLEDLQTMIDLYKSGATAKAVAEKFGISERSIKRLLHQYGSTPWSAPRLNVVR